MLLNYHLLVELTDVALRGRQPTISNVFNVTFFSFYVLLSLTSDEVLSAGPEEDRNGKIQKN